VKLNVSLMKRIISNQGDIKINSIAKGEHLLMNVNSAATVGIVTDVSKKGTFLDLRIPVSAEKGQKISLSRQIGNRFRLIGYGEIIE
ncbi:MAG: translation initiation factor IF-2 subunit gamma, partial [Candidatus Woesearchaeota archaeon]